jgi:ribonuclease BN (tRNA processing enzyme)
LHPNESASVKGIEVFPFRVPHQTADISLALKVAYDGRQVLFSGDSAWTDEFITHARGMDLFLCECSFFTEQPAMHVDYQKLRANRAQLECKKLLLTHLGEEMLARKNELEAPFAEDGMILTI